MDLTNKNAIKEFLYVSFEIDSTLKVREKFKRCFTDEEKKKLYHYVVLKNLFLLRRCHDPGFYTFVLNQVNTDEKIKTSVKQYVSKLVTANSNINQDIFGEFIVEKNKPLLDKQIKNPTTWPYSSHVKKMDNFIDVNKNSLYYLSKELDYAREQGNDDKSIAILQLINDYESGDFWGHLIFSEDKLYGEQIDSHRWKHYQNQYILENIKFGTHYFYSRPFSLRNLIPIVNYNPTFVKELLIIMGEKIDAEERPMLNSFLDFNQFINDAFSVASLIWFNKNSEKDKIDILNKEYSFDITEKILDEYDSAMHEYGMIKEEGDNTSLFVFANELYHSHFFDESKNVWEYMLKKATRDSAVYNYCDNLATVFRDMGNFESALKYYKQSLELAKELSKSDLAHTQQKNSHSQPFKNEIEKEVYDYLKRYENKFQNYDYKVAIELKNVGEMHHKLGQTELGKKCFLDAEEKGSQLSSFERDSILVNLSHANKRLNWFDDEFKYLAKLVSQDVIDPDVEKYALDRLGTLNSIDFMLPHGGFDYKKLAKIESTQKVNQLSTIGISLFHSFQFKKSMYYFEKAYEIEKLNGLNCFDSLNYMATYNLYYGDLQKAKYMCEKLIENAYIPFHVPMARVNIGLIEIKENNFENGIEQLGIACDIFNQFDNGMVEFLKDIINSSTIFWSKENVHRIIDYLEPKIKSKNVNFNLMAGCAYLEIGFFEDAVNYFERGLLKDEDIEVQSLLLYNKGLALSAMGEAKNAIQMYKNSLDYMDSSYAWEGMAQEYRNKLDTLNAKKCIVEAIKLVSGKEKEKLNRIKKELETLSSKQLNLNSIVDEDIKKTLFSAEKLVISDVKKIEYVNERDFSTALHYYGKALENMLDIQISNNMRRIIYHEFGDCVTEDYSSFNGPQFPFSLKNMLDKNKKYSIGLGSWKLILHYINERSKNPVYQKFKAELINLYSIEGLMKIKFACGMIKEYRNSSVHTEVKSYDDVVKNREKIVLHLNNVIYVIYK